MSQDLLQNDLTRSVYFGLNGLQREVVDKEYEKCLKATTSQMESLPDRLSIEELMKRFLTPSEELIPIKPLMGLRYDVRLSNDPGNIQDFGFNVELHLSNKRLMLVQTGMSNYPILKKQEYAGNTERIDVGYKKQDSYSFVAFPLNSIYGISLKLENTISNTSVIRKIRGANSTLIIIGAVAALLGLLFMGNNSIAAFGFLILIVGIALAIMGILQKSEDVTRPQPEVLKTRKLRLVTLDPLYKNRASLSIDIDSRHDINSIIQWTRELQNICEPLSHAKAFETVMNV